VLTREGRVQITGFARCASPTAAPTDDYSCAAVRLAAGVPIAPQWCHRMSAESAADDEGGAAADGTVPLRPTHRLDAPELRGRTSASPSELYAADVWSLGIMLVYMLTGEPSAAVPALEAVLLERSDSGLGDLGTAVHSLDLSDLTGADLESLTQLATRPPPPPSATAAARERLRAALELARRMLHTDPTRRPTAAVVSAELTRVHS